MKLRERNPDPQVIAELDALDAVLAGRPVSAEHDELATLARALQADRPQIDRGFAAQLDARADAGFPPHGAGDAVPRPTRIGTLRKRLRSGIRPLPAMAGAMTVLFAVAVGVSALDQGGPGGAGDDLGVQGSPLNAVEAAPEPGGDTAAGQSATATGGSAASPGIPAGSAKSAPDRASVPPVSSPPLPGPSGRPGRRERVQETSASLTLSTKPGDLPDVADGVVSASDRAGGFVESSNVSSGEGSHQRATFTLRVPSQNLRSLLADLSDLAHVVSRNEGSVDITEPFVSAGERFSDAKATVAKLLDELEQASGSTEIEALRLQLRSARGELAGARAQLAEIKGRAGFSRVDVAITATGDGPGWSLGDAFDDAGGILKAIAGATLVALAVIIPVGLILAAAWFGSAGIRRRRRERGLDS